MERFTRITGVALPLIRDNVDTDAIIPSREMKTVTKTGLAAGLFAGWRYLAGSREPDPAFVMNHPAYAGAQILLGGANFGCGSSREHAVWALREYGFRAVIAPSFAPIFSANCLRNGLLPVVLSAPQVDAVTAACAAGADAQEVTVDLVHTYVRVGDRSYVFSIDVEARDMLLAGADAIDLTLRSRAAIDAFVEQDRIARPWIYAPVRSDTP